MHGHGLMVYADGSKYEGQFVQGKKCGHGTRFFSSGDHYIGQFRDNMMNGTGIYYSVAQQNKRQGEWLNGKRVSWLTAPQPYNVSIEEIRRDDQDLDRSSVRGTLYRGGKWRQVADAALQVRKSSRVRAQPRCSLSSGALPTLRAEDPHEELPTIANCPLGTCGSIHPARKRSGPFARAESTVCWRAG